MQVILMHGLAGARNIVDLRTRLYRAAGKHRHDGEMQDRFDAGAMHIFVVNAGKPVAAARVLALPAEDEWEHDRFLEWPRNWPTRARVAEISRFLIHPMHRTWKVTRRLCFGVALAMYQTRRDYFIACCTTELEDFYKTFFGADMTGITIQHEDLGPKSHRMFVCDYKRGLLGYGMPLIPWLSLWPRVALLGLWNDQFSERMGAVRRAYEIAKCAFGCLLVPAATRLVERKRRLRRRVSAVSSDGTRKRGQMDTPR